MQRVLAVPTVKFGEGSSMRPLIGFNVRAARAPTFVRRLFCASPNSAAVPSQIHSTTTLLSNS
jgi:hypothetical protein